MKMKSFQNKILTKPSKEIIHKFFCTDNEGMKAQAGMRKVGQLWANSMIRTVFWVFGHHNGTRHVGLGKAFLNSFWFNFSIIFECVTILFYF